MLYCSSNNVQLSMFFEATLTQSGLHTNTRGFMCVDNGEDHFISYNLAPHDIAQIQKISSEKEIVTFFSEFQGNDFFALGYLKKQGLFFAVNDHFGSNEILYTWMDNKLYLTDSIHHLKAQVPDLEINFSHINESLAFRMINPPNTVFNDVYSVPLGSILFIDINTRSEYTTEYWSPLLELNKKNLDYQSLVSEIQSGFCKSAELESARDDQLGIALSGGIDSGAFLSLAHHVTGKTIKSISVGPHGESSSDLISARETARFNSSPQVEIYPSYDHLTLLPRYIENLSQPADGQVVFANSLIFEAAKEAGVSRMMYGYGPEHFLGCLRQSRLAFYMDRISFLPPQIRKTALKTLSYVMGFSENQKMITLASDWTERYFLLKSMNFWRERPYLKIDDDPFDTIVQSDFRKVFDNENFNIVDKLVYADWKLIHVYNRHGLMNKMSRPFDISIYNPSYTVQGATPLFHMPNKFRKLNNWDKQIFRDAMKKYAPEHLYKNKGKAFLLNLQTWFGSADHPFKRYLEESTFLSNIYDIERFHAEFDGSKESALATLRLVSLVLWHDLHFTNNGKERYMEAHHASRGKFL